MHHSDLTLHHIMLYIFAASSLSRNGVTRWPVPVGRVPLKRSVITVKKEGLLLVSSNGFTLGYGLLVNRSPKKR